MHNSWKWMRLLSHSGNKRHRNRRTFIAKRHNLAVKYQRLWTFREYINRFNIVMHNANITNNINYPNTHNNIYIIIFLFKKSFLILFIKFRSVETLLTKIIIFLYDCFVSVFSLPFQILYQFYLILSHIDLNPCLFCTLLYNTNIIHIMKDNKARNKRALKALAAPRSLITRGNSYFLRFNALIRSKDPMSHWIHERFPSIPLKRARPHDDDAEYKGGFRVPSRRRRGASSLPPQPC